MRAIRALIKAAITTTKNNKIFDNVEIEFRLTKNALIKIVLTNGAENIRPEENPLPLNMRPLYSSPVSDITP